MGVKEIINRLYAYKDESNDERLNDLIDDVIKLIIDECKPNTNRKVYEMPNGKTTIFEFDENGIGKITVEAMDRLVELVGAEPTDICDECIYVKGSRWCDECNGEPKHWRKGE